METVTFYSYKGGVGRSTLLAHCALHLARVGVRVLVIDFDLDAPGMHYLLRPPQPVRRGIVDLIDDYVTKGVLYESLADATYVIPGVALAGRGELRVLPAGNAPEKPYWERLGRIDWRVFLYDPQQTGPEFLQDLRERIRVEFAPDLILIDSRTGLTELSHASLSLLADTIVCVVADNDENLDGARTVLRGASAQIEQASGSRPRILVAVSRTTDGVPWERREQRVRAALETPGERLDHALTIAELFELPHEPALDRGTRLLLDTFLGREAPLAETSRRLAERLVAQLPPLDLPPGDPATKTLFRGVGPTVTAFAVEYAGLDIAGVYRVGDRAVIVCPELDTKPEPIEWLAAHKSMTAPVFLAKEVPEGGVRMEMPSLEDLVELADTPFTHREILRELTLRLPHDFPEFTHGSERPRYEFITPRPLTQGEEHLARQAFASLGYGEWFEFEPVVRPDLNWNQPREPVSRRSGDISLLPARWLPTEFSPEVRRLVERDDDRWMHRRHALFRGEITSPEEFLPAALKPPRLRALVNASALPPREIAGLFALFDVVCLVLPLADHEQHAFDAMGVSLAQWIELAREGRVVFLLPQSLDRYAAPTVNHLADAVPHALLFSRALGSATIIALQQQLGPLLFPSLGVAERHLRLRELDRRRKEGLVPFSKLPIHVPLRRNWAFGEWFAHVYGAMAHAYTGLGELVSALLAEAGKPDHHLEFTQAWNSVAWTSATDAVLVSAEVPGYAEHTILTALLKPIAALAVSFSGEAVGSLSLLLPRALVDAQQTFRATTEHPIRKLVRSGDLTSAASESESWTEAVLACTTAVPLDAWCIEAISCGARAPSESPAPSDRSLRPWLVGDELASVFVQGERSGHGHPWRLCSRKTPSLFGGVNALQSVRVDDAVPDVRA